VNSPISRLIPGAGKRTALSDWREQIDRALSPREKPAALPGRDCKARINWPPFLPALRPPVLRCRALHRVLSRLLLLLPCRSAAADALEPCMRRAAHLTKLIATGTRYDRDEQGVCHKMPVFSPCCSRYTGRPAGRNSRRLIDVTRAGTFVVNIGNCSSWHRTDLRAHFTASSRASGVERLSWPSSRRRPDANVPCSTASALPPGPGRRAIRNPLFRSVGQNYLKDDCVASDVAQRHYADCSSGRQPWRLPATDRPLNKMTTSEQTTARSFCHIYRCNARVGMRVRRRYATPAPAAAPARLYRATREALHELPWK